MLRMMSTSTNAMSNIVRNLKQVQEKIQTASGKRSQNLQGLQPRLVAVTKTKPVEMIIEAYDAGQRHFGENYVNELHEKANDIELQDRCEEIKWHFIGHLQRNKISKILESYGVREEGMQMAVVSRGRGHKDTPNLFVVETVDSERLAKALSDGWARYNKKDKLNIMVQCNTSGEENKSGCPAQALVGFVKYVKEECLNLNLIGLMTIGRFDHDLATGPNPDFQLLIKLREDVCRDLGIGLEELELSMGMSGDFEHAIEVGSTNVRIGSTIFGAREKKPDLSSSESKAVPDNKVTDSQGFNISQKLEDATTTGS